MRQPLSLRRIFQQAQERYQRVDQAQHTNLEHLNQLELNLSQVFPLLLLADPCLDSEGDDGDEVK